MARLNFAALIVIMITAGCVSDVPQMASDGKPVPKPYFLSQVEPAIIKFRMLDGVNALRQSRGADVVNLNAQKIGCTRKRHSSSSYFSRKHRLQS